MKECVNGHEWDVADDVPACPWCGEPLVDAVDRPVWHPTPGHPYQLADLQPLRDRIIVGPLPVPAKTTGGLFLAETSHQRERPHHGIVLKVGPGAWNKTFDGVAPMSVQVGDCIFYGKYSGQEMELGGRSVLNMAEIEVYAKLPKGTFVLVEHEDPKHSHLAGDYCEICASPEEKAAKASLEQERKRLVEDAITKAGTVSALQPVDAAPELAAMTAAAASTETAAKSALEQERERLRQKRGEATS